MKTRKWGALRLATLGLCALLVPSVFAAEAVTTPTLQSFRDQYDAMMSGFERVLVAKGDAAGVDRVQRARDAMKTLSDNQLYAVYGTHVPDLSAAVKASDVLAARAENRLFEKLAPSGSVSNKSAGFPDPVPIVAGCDGVDTTAETRYALFIIKEVANSVLAAAAWVCNEDILGENGSLACVPLAIAADVANGFFDTATFCAGELTANQVDANFNRLDHIHNDLENDATNIMNNDNSNTTSIENNDNANTTNILNNDNANTASIITNDNTNTTNIENNDNANTTNILNNANANKNELRDLILRTQIEADLAMVDSSAVVALYETPTANGGYLDLVTFIVTDTITKIQQAGGSTGTAAAFLSDANAKKAAGDFKGAYASYRKAYKAAGK